METSDTFETPPHVHSQEVDDAEEEELVEPVDDDEDEDHLADDDEGDGTDGAVNASLIRAKPALYFLEKGHYRELGHDAIWSLSSAKPGNGVEQIRDNSVDTYWQSDGSQPHLIRIAFSRRCALSHLAIYMDYNLDESYTPQRLSIQYGMTPQELMDLTQVQLKEPVGWCTIPLSVPPDPIMMELLGEQGGANNNGDDSTTPSSSSSSDLQPIKTHLLQISILTMHQNGRDTHVRQVKLFGPKSTPDHRLADQWAVGVPNFSTVGMSQFSTIR